MDTEKYPLPPGFFVYLVDDPKQPFYQIFQGLTSSFLPDDDDPRCVYRGDDAEKARQIALAKNIELERMRKIQTLDLNL